MVPDAEREGKWRNEWDWMGWLFIIRSKVGWLCEYSAAVRLLCPLTLDMMRSAIIYWPWLARSNAAVQYCCVETHSRGTLICLTATATDTALPSCLDSGAELHKFFCGERVPGYRWAVMRNHGTQCICSSPYHSAALDKIYGTCVLSWMLFKVGLVFSYKHRCNIGKWS